MRKSIFPFLLLIILAAAFNSNATQSIINPEQTCITITSSDTIPIIDSVFQYVEIEASFIGGDDAWANFLRANLKADIPAKRKAPVGLFTVLVQFIVDKEGRVSNIQALTNHGFGMEQEVMRVLRKSPRWGAAVQDGRKVKAYRKQPVTFSISEI